MPAQRPASKRNDQHVQLSPYTPGPDANTYRDLLIFEERLKQNAARLHARKNKYQTLLAVSVAFILFLSYHVLIDRKESVPLHYLILSLLLICLTTLFLFFASGMHAERIRAANKFVPQANRSLRNFNMYLNTRVHPGRRSFLSFFSASITPPPPATSRNQTAALASQRPPISTATGGATPKRAAIPPIPPAQNSRGELIFSTKVSPDFRDGYERYRAAFERRRAEKMMAKRARSWKRWIDWIMAFVPFLRRRSKISSTTTVHADAQEGRGRTESMTSESTRTGEAAASGGRRRKAAGVSKKGRERVGSTVVASAASASKDNVVAPSDVESPSSSVPGMPDIGHLQNDALSNGNEAQSHPATSEQDEDDNIDAAEAEQQLDNGGPRRQQGDDQGPSQERQEDKAAQLGQEWIQVTRSSTRPRLGRGESSSRGP